MSKNTEDAFNNSETLAHLAHRMKKSKTKQNITQPTKQMINTDTTKTIGVVSGVYQW
jgi:hypothetical protein